MKSVVDKRQHKPELGPKARVKQVYPDAFADDDGESVRIINRKTVTERCTSCGQDWTHKAVDWSQILGKGGSENAAWERAARDLQSR